MQSTSDWHASGVKLLDCHLFSRSWLNRALIGHSCTTQKWNHFSASNLKKAIDARTSVEQTVTYNPINSIPNRIVDVADNKGDVTKYHLYFACTIFVMNWDFIRWTYNFAPSYFFLFSLKAHDVLYWSCILHRFLTQRFCWWETRWWHCWTSVAGTLINGGWLRSGPTYNLTTRYVVHCWWVVRGKGTCNAHSTFENAWSGLESALLSANSIQIKLIALRVEKWSNVVDHEPEMWVLHSCSLQIFFLQLDVLRALIWVLLMNVYCPNLKSET